MVEVHRGTFAIYIHIVIFMAWLLHTQGKEPWVTTEWEGVWTSDPTQMDKRKPLSPAWH